MDNLTHTLTGILLSRAGLNRLAPCAVGLAVAGSNLPDLDISTGLGGSLCYLAHHRGATHALFWLPLLALLPLPVWWFFARKRALTRAHWIGAYAITFLSAGCHLLFDLLNVYGIRILLPFSNQWFRLDLLNIIDIWVWTLLLLFVLAPLLGRLVSGEIGAPSRPKSAPAGRGSAITALALLSLYILGRAELHARAVETLNSRIYGKETPLQVVALPGAVNPWQWTGLVETTRAWRVLPVDLLTEFDPDAARIFYKPENIAARPAILRTETARVFLDFSKCPLWRITPAANSDGGASVAIYDLRFGLPGSGAFSASFLIDPSGQVVRQRFGFGKMEPENH